MNNMTSHQLAQILLKQKDVPVVVNGWGSDEGLGPFVVTGVDEPDKQHVILAGERQDLEVITLNYD
jgi:hypothetical protein